MEGKPDPMIFVHAATISAAPSREASRRIRSQLTTRLRHRQQQQQQQQQARKQQSPPYRVLCPRCSALDEPPDLCRTCGSRQTHVAATAKQYPVPVQPPSPSPRSHLSGVALEADPSATVVLNDWKFHALTQFTVRVILPGMRPDEDYAQRFLHDAIRDSVNKPLMLEPVLLNAASHLSALGVEPWKDLTAELLARRNNVFRLVREGLNSGYQLDEMLNTMVMLAAGIHTIGLELLPKEHNPCSTPMLGMQWLDVYITRPLGQIHWKGVHRLLELHGGLRAVTKYSLPFHLTRAGLMDSAITATAPVYPLLQPNGQEFPDISPLEYLHITSPPVNLIDLQGFSVLHNFAVPYDVTRRFIHLRQLSWVIAEELKSVDRQSLLDCRNVVQHRILSLPENLSSLGSIETSGSNRSVLAETVYSACRAAAILYSIHVTFPLPRRGAAKDRVLPPLQSAIEKALQDEKCMTECLSALLWCSIIGGMFSSIQRPWFIARAHELSSRLHMQSWDQARDVLIRFTWLSSACDHPGKRFWDEVVDLSSESTLRIPRVLGAG